MLLAAALAKSITVAVHYRDEVLALRRQGHLPRLSAPPSPAHTRPSPLTLVSETSTLPSSRPLTVQVTAFTARSFAGSAWVIVTARVVAAARTPAMSCPAVTALATPPTGPGPLASPARADRRT
jgi:hypothetical protein